MELVHQWAAHRWPTPEERINLLHAGVIPPGTSTSSDSANEHTEEVIIMVDQPRYLILLLSLFDRSHEHHKIDGKCNTAVLDTAKAKSEGDREKIRATFSFLARMESHPLDMTSCTVIEYDQ
ncbi:hypothetical protein VTN77DRAFT_6872 [Rasamsonia byssochlamydoides]|uniref:uncharacterized protein n=1 Tax=Rasamsonia byssochlamydoides TaxID=89139 RepID=UPI0037438911